MRRFTLALAAAAALLAAPALAQDGAETACGTEVQFRERFAGQLRTALPDKKIVVSDILQLTIGEEEDGVIVNLDNKYLDCLDRPQLRDDIIAHFVQAVANHVTNPPAEATVEERRARMFSIIRPAAVTSDPSLQGQKLLTRPFVGDMVEIIAEQHPGQISYGMEADLEALGPDLAQAWARARANVKTRINGITVRPLGAGVYIVEAESFDAPSLLFEPGFWSQRTTADTGQPVVFLADRELFLYADSANAEAVAALREYRERDNGNAMSLMLFRRRPDGSWETMR